MEIERFRLAADTRGALYAALFRFARRAKALAKWLPTAALNRLTGGREPAVAAAAETWRRIARLRSDDAIALPPEIESHIRWEWHV